MKLGIVGFARSGKTTVFDAITGAHAAVGAFGSREANLAAIKVPDPRLDYLETVFKPKKKTYAEVQFVDIAPNEAAEADKALDAAALNSLKNADALVHVVRAFKNEDVAHPRGAVNPEADCKALEEELQLSDLIIIERRIERLEKENRKGPELSLLTRCRAHIESGASLHRMPLSPQEEKDIMGFSFLSLKPMLLLGNYGEESIGRPNPSGLDDYAARTGQTLIALCGAMEFEVAQLPEEERLAFREGLGLGEESRTRFLHAAYDMLGLMSFLTAGDPEVHAWTIRKGTHALEAAGVIHSDIQRGFIRAEVIGYDDFAAAGSMHHAKELGKVRLEGKDYVVRDGDIILFRFNV